MIGHLKIKMLQLVTRRDSDLVSSMWKLDKPLPNNSCTILLMHTIWNRRLMMDPCHGSGS